MKSASGGEKAKVVIFVSGGVIQAVYTDKPEFIEVEIVDFDDENGTAEMESRWSEIVGDERFVLVS